MLTAPAKPLAGNTLKILWDRLNDIRDEMSLPKLSYADLAALVATPNDSIPGEALRCSKSIINQLFNNRYSADTKHAFAARVNTIIFLRFSDLGKQQDYFQAGGDCYVATPARKVIMSKPASKKYRVRVNTKGSMYFQNRFYCPGSTFAGHIINVEKLKGDKDAALRISLEVKGEFFAKTIYPCHPLETSQ